MIKRMLVVAGLVLGIIAVVVAMMATKANLDFAVAAAGLGVSSLAVAALL